MKKVRKMDELEMKINQGSIKVSYLATTLFLAVWSLYDIIIGNGLSLAGMIFGANILVLIVSRVIFSKKYELLEKIIYIFIGIGALAVMAVVLIIGFFFTK